MEKHALRTHFKEIRNSLPESYRHQVALEVIPYFQELSSFPGLLRLPTLKLRQARNDKVIGLYYPIHSEFDTRPLMHALLAQGTFIALPYSFNHHMEFYLVSDLKALDKDDRNILAPQTRTAVIPDMLIVPLLAYDKFGYRLGYGKGYFDKYITTLKTKPYLLGLGFACQYAPTPLPHEAHDIPLDNVLTEGGLMIR